MLFINISIDFMKQRFYMIWNDDYNKHSDTQTKISCTYTQFEEYIKNLLTSVLTLFSNGVTIFLSRLYGL